MTPGPTPSPAGRPEPDPREDEADSHGPLLTASAPSVAGRLVQAHRGFLDHAGPPVTE